MLGRQRNGQRVDQKDQIIVEVEVVIVEVVTPEEWEFSSHFNYHKGKEDDLKRGNCR